MKFADLHLHTAFSDGTYTPEELVKKAKAKGLSVIAIADHDSVEGIPLALKAAKKENIEVIPGIELTAECESLEIHILGYFIDYKDRHFQDKLCSLAKIRKERVYKILDKLAKLGVKLDPRVVFDISGSGTTGRLHIARALLREGAIKSVNEAFQKYIGDHCPAYVCGFRFSPQDAIKLIRGVGGVAVLAHPYLLRRDELIPEFVKYGLQGLEVYYPEHTQAMINFYLGMAKKHNLLVTGGSDCHGLAKPEVKLGMIKLPYELVEKLKEAKKK